MSSSRKACDDSLIVILITPRLISDHLLVITVHSSLSPAMSTANEEAQSSSDLPVRQGALSAEQIRARCPQFRIGKANAGKTTILRKVCNAKPDAKPIIYDPEGKKIPTKVWFGNLVVLAEINYKVIMIVSTVLAL